MTPQSRYDESHTTQVKLKLNLRTDADLIKWLKAQPNKQGAIKALIRAEMSGKEMKHYYLIAEKGFNVRHVRVSDALGPGRECLLKFEASSYSDAVKMFSFAAANCGKTAICGISGNGQPYAEIYD